MTPALLSQIVASAVWAATLFAFVSLDQRRRRIARGDGVSFEEGRAWPYVVLSGVVGSLAVPIYFYATRRSARGFLVGILWMVVLGAFVFAVTLGARLVLALLS